MSAMLGGLLDHVHEDPPEAHRPATERRLGGAVTETRVAGGRASTPLARRDIERTQVGGESSPAEWKSQSASTSSGADHVRELDHRLSLPARRWRVYEARIST
ncbi:hypothetical protein GCM10029963_04390 [Micromonospora andamanensis]